MFLTYRRTERPIQMLDTAYHLLNGPRSKLCDGSIAGRMTTKLRCYKNGLLTYRAILEDGDAFLRDFLGTTAEIYQESNKSRMRFGIEGKVPDNFRHPDRILVGEATYPRHDRPFGLRITPQARCIPAVHRGSFACRRDVSVLGWRSNRHPMVQPRGP